MIGQSGNPQRSPVNPDLIERIIDTRLIRREPNTVSGTSFELSHDALIDPVLSAAIELGDLDAALEIGRMIRAKGLTTIVGFGSLMIADHRGIFGLGLLLTLGTATSLIAEGLADGSLAPCDPKIAAFTIAGALNWPARWHDPTGSESPQDLARQMIDLLARGFLPR